MIQANDPITTSPRFDTGSETSERPITELLKELRDETTELLRQEVELAKAETTEKAKRLGRNVGYLAVGALIGYAGFIFLLWAFTHGMFVAMTEAGAAADVAAWVSPLITGLIVTGIGGAFIAKAISTLRGETLTPQRTVESMKENKQWLSTKLT